VEQATGFRFDTESNLWRQASFRAEQKFILKRTDEKQYEVMPGTRVRVAGVWAVWEFGNDHWPAFICRSEFSEYGGLWCESATTERFGFNLTNGRFITDNLLGYIQPGMPGYRGIDGKVLPEGSNTPSMQIGKCAAL
jgi:hypothetical protein